MRKVTYFFALLSAVIFGAMTYIEYGQMHLISGGLKSPDFRIGGYSFEALDAWHQAIGPQGTALYIKAFPKGLDAVFPLVFGITLVLLLTAVLNRFARFTKMSPVFKVALPLFLVTPYVILDYFENSVILDILSGDFVWGRGFIDFANMLTVSKYFFLAIALLILAGFWLASLKLKKADGQ